jgi:hypothetical protein
MLFATCNRKERKKKKKKKKKSEGKKTMVKMHSKELQILLYIKIACHFPQK